MNKCFLMGNLTKDPEVASTSSGVAVTKFTIACNRNYTNANGEREADFLNIVTWRGLAENCGKYLSKGSKVAVTGAITTRSYEADDGSKRYVTEILADEVEFIKTATESAPATDSKTKAKKNKTIAELTPIEADNDFPF